MFTYMIQHKRCMISNFIGAPSWNFKNMGKYCLHTKKILFEILSASFARGQIMPENALKLGTKYFP